MGRVYITPTTHICDLCTQGFVIQTVTKPSVALCDTLYNNDLKPARLCWSCRDSITQWPEIYVCNFKGCRVLKQENRNYCIRHDENSPPIKFESPTIKTWDND